MENKITKILGIEVVRFLSAFAVLIWHYQHFAFGSSAPFVTEDQPFFSIFTIMYKYGLHGVQIFWALSGYIFFWKYRETIAQGRIGGKKFSILRFSRLYPLHIVTLILVAVLQLIYFGKNGNYFIYAHNDLRHFFLQIFMASDWGFEAGNSFNGPIWSVSIEILVYLVFFLGLKFLGSSLIPSILMVLISGIALKLKIPHPVLLCLLFFYVGGIVATSQSLFHKYLKLFDILSFLGLIALYFIGSTRNIASIYIVLGMAPLIIHLASRYHPPLILENFVSALGNMTYSSYLIQFPLQLGIAITYSFMGSPIPYLENGFFILYILSVLVLARVIFLYLECPAQDWVRSKFGR